MPATPFKLFGLQRSGTNLARWLLLHNFEAVSLEVGNEWKHGAIASEHQNWICDGEHVRLIICIKNPYAWLVSCYNYFASNRYADRTIDNNFDETWDFNQFVMSPSYHFTNPIVRWNSMVRHWIEFPTHRQFSEVVLHESMLNAKSQLEVLTRIENNQHLLRKREGIRDISERVDIGMQLREPFQFEYYLSRCYLDHYSERLLNFVNQFVDADLFKRFGYQKISYSSIERFKSQR